MSDTTGVKVNITADTSGYQDPLDRAKVTSADFAAALRAAGNDLRKITTDMLGTTGSYDGLSNAILKATNASQQAAVTFAAFSAAGIGAGASMKDAAGSAEVFTRALNPTPLQQLRSLMGDEIPAAFRMTQSGTQAVIGSLMGLDSGFKSAAESAEVFSKAISPSPLQAFRTGMAAIASGNVVTQTSMQQLVASTTGLDVTFKSAADSAAVFNREISRPTIAQLRASLSALPAVLEDTQANLQASINAATGVDRSFKSAAESATVFSAALNPTPLQNLRTLMTETAPAAQTLAVNFQGIIDANTGVSASFKSAQDSADVFSRELARIPLAELRRTLGDEIPAAAKATTTNFRDVIEASTGVGRALKSAEDSAKVFNAALDPTPLQRIRQLMASDLPAAAEKTTLDFQGLINASTGVDRTFKSAADSADVFTRELNRIPTAQLRRSLGEDIPGAVKVMTSTLQENINAANGMGNALKSAEESARVFQQALDPTPLQRMRTLMADEMPAAAHGSAGAMSGITRELIVLGHEGMVGNWTRIPGSLLVLTEYAGGLRTALGNMIASFTLMQGAGVAAVLAVAAAFVTMAIRAHEAAVAINEATNAAVMQGRSPAEARAQMKSYGDQMRDTGIMGETAMARVSSSISQLGELTAAQKDKLAAIGTPLFLAWDSDAKKTGENLAGIFSSTSAMESYLQKEHLLSEAQLTAWSQASTAKDKYDIGLQALTARFAPLTAEIKKAGEEARANQAMMFAAADTPGATMNLTGALTTPSHLGDFEGGGKQADPGAMADTEAVIEGNKHLQEKASLQARLEAQQRDLTRATQEGNQSEIAMANSAIANTQNQIAMWHAAGDTTWEAAQQGALNTILTRLAATATSSKQLAMDENAARIAFWADAEKNAGGVESRITTARANGARARLALSGEELRGNEAGQAGWMAKQQAALSEQLVAVAASAKSSKALAEDENRTRIKFWDDLVKAGGLTEKELTAARAEGNRARLALSGEEVRGGESAAKQALAAKLATLSEEQAANHDNFAKVMEIEGQKVALLRAAGANETKQLEEELTKQDNLRRQHQQQVIQQAEQALSSEQRLHTQEIAERKAELDMEVSERNISKNQEMQILRGFAAEKHALDIADAESVLATIDQQLPAYKALYDKILVMKRQFSVEDRKLNAEGAADLKRQWDAATAPVSSAMDSQIGSVMRGTSTIGQAFASMLGNIVVGYAEMGVKAAMHWASSQLMQLVLHRSTELAKTASSAAGASARGAIATSETATENAGLLVRIGRWIATQFGETAATTTGAATRAGVLTAEQTASAEATALTARLSIAAAAAVAAAWAFADSAEAGIPGLIAAPGVSAGAYATVMAYQATVPGLAVGAWDVPHDMLANIHAGEMVVPANFASGMRGSLAGGASGGDTNLHYSPQVSGGNQDMAGMMRAQAGAFKSYLWHATRNGALKLPGR